ncbi:MAG: DUF192 domain-containing protein [Nitrospirae bacterium]|nr:DUF192 domain-containing protein [Nitrospirota bacterium]MBI3352334.1 DUF192 domain-containing protein [Nitrospirota bacterium]
MSRFFYLLLFYLFIALGRPVDASQTANIDQKKISIILPGGEKIEAVVADTTTARSTGLMGRSRLGLNEGMLFLFKTTEPHLMWMKNMLIPIDIIWLNEKKEIIEIVQSAPPCSNDPCEVFGPELPSRYVLEIKDGSSNLLHLQKGLTLKFP